MRYSGNWNLRMVKIAALVFTTTVLPSVGIPDDGSRTLPIRFEPDPTSIRILAGARLVAIYRWTGPRGPSFHPIIGPTGTNVLREYPFTIAPGESHDHPHHAGMWLAHGDVNGHDFWSSKRGEHIQQVAILQLDDVTGRLVTSNHWIATDRTIAADTRAWTIRAWEDGALVFDLEWRLFALKDDLILGDTKEGTLALRIATALQCDPPGNGTLINSEGEAGADAWARRARWCRAAGQLGGNAVSVLLFDHPSNPGHPNGWHVRTYGLLSANPFARKSFQLADEPSPVRLTPGSSIRYCWRVAIVRGSWPPHVIEQAWSNWTAHVHNR